LLAALVEAGHEVGIVSRQEHVGIFRSDLIHAHGVADIGDPLSILPEVRARAYDVALIATEKPYGYLLAYEASIPERIGFVHGFTKPFKGAWVRRLCTDTRRRGFSLFPRHEAEVLFTLGQGRHWEIEPTCDANELRNLFFPRRVPRRRLLSVQVTEKWRSYGIYPVFLAFLRKLARDAPLRLIGAAGEEEFLAETEERIGIAVKRYQSVSSWMRSIASSRALLTPDTGAAHVAGMVGTAVIDVFPNGASRRFQDRWRPWAAPIALLLNAKALSRQDPSTLYEAVME
jgi:ADP-heptose:LPS heptosyltransferase